MATLRVELELALSRLLTRSEASLLVTLDQVGDALGILSVSTDEIDAILSALEAAGRSVVGPTGEGAERLLARVVHAARALRASGERPTLERVAGEAGITREQTLAALALLRVMQR